MVTVSFVNPSYVWGILFLFAILALAIWIYCIENRRRCSSKPKKCSEDPCGKKKKRKCKDSNDGCFNWFSWGKINKGSRKFDKSAFYSCNFWVFVVLTLLTRYSWWSLILAAIVWVILIEIAKCVSRCFRRELCRVKWFSVLIVAVAGVIVGLILLGFSCAFPPAQWCYGVASNMAYTVEYNKNNLPLDGLSVAAPSARTGLFGY